MSNLSRIDKIYIPSFIRRFIVFCGVGIFNALIGFILFFVFYKILGWYYLIANFCSYFLSVILGFFTHKYITFKDSGNIEWGLWSIAQHIRKFSFIFSVSYAIQFGSVFVMVDVFRFWVLPSQFIAITIFVIVSYIGNRCITFRS